MSTYAWVEVCSVIVPFLFGFHPRLRFHRHWRAYGAGILIMMALFIPWDAWFTGLGVWGFNAEHVWPLRLAGLPVEEWAFFVCIPYCCLYCYHSFQVLGLRPFPPIITRRISYALLVVLVLVAAFHYERAYTSSALGLCAVWLAFTAFVQKASWLGRFLITYVIILVPFLIVNGILTGTGLEQPVVWYDNTENLGIRILTIPVEDVFYGMLMVGLATSVYEYVINRQGSGSQWSQKAVQPQ